MVKDKNQCDDRIQPHFMHISCLRLLIRRFPSPNFSNVKIHLCKIHDRDFNPVLRIGSPQQTINEVFVFSGIKAQEVGQTAGHEKGTEARGAYSYTGDDGQVYTVTYTADENGFHAQGAHLPTPPPMPEAIAKSLEQNAKDEAAGIYDNGKGF